MKRAPIVLTSTACGLVAVVGYHAATPQALALTNASGSAGTGTVSTGSASSGSASSGSAGSGGAGTTKSSARGSAANSSTAGASAANSSGASTSATTASAASSGTRSAVGSDVQYPFGDVELKVTMTGSRITDVSVVRHDAYDPRSAMIDQIAIPELRAQALKVQSARIDGVSGASYTSAAYQQSLQSAIDKLKV